MFFLNFYIISSKFFYKISLIPSNQWFGSVPVLNGNYLLPVPVLYETIPLLGASSSYVTMMLNFDKCWISDFV